MNWCQDTLSVNLEKGIITLKEGDHDREIELNSPEGFQVMANLWLRAGWDSKYVYSFSWMGRPVIQLPDDMMRIQEAIYTVKPNIIIETGVAHGGSLIYYASLLKMMDMKASKVIGIDIEIRPKNRKAIEEHELYPYITLLEGSSVDPEILNKTKSHVKEGDKVMVLLDSNHSYDHVYQEIEAYSPMVTTNSYIVVTDGIMKDLEGAPRSQPGWSKDNPYQAACDFLKTTNDFVFSPPSWPFNESDSLDAEVCVSYWPGGWLKRVKN